MTHRRILVLLMAALLALSARPVQAENEGQADLDKAMQAKLTAESLADLEEVIQLSKLALSKGLDEANQQFAQELLATTLLQRASIYSQQIFDRTPPNPQWTRLRQLALSDLEQAVEAVPELEMAHRLIARLQLLPGGDRERARKALDQSIQLASEDDEAKAEALLLRAGLQEKPEEKLADLNEAVRLAPTSAGALRTRAVYLLSQNKVDEALADLKKAIEIDPENLELYNAQGIALTLDKKYEEALAAFEKLIELAPDSPVPYLQRARVYTVQKKWDEALEDLNKVLELEPDSVPALLLRATVQSERGERGQALADVEKALTEQPDHGEAILLHAQLAAMEGKWRAAIADLERLRSQMPENEQLLVQLARFYTAGKQPRKAIELYNEVLEEQPEHWEALRGRADAYLSIGKQREAIADYEQAVKLQPDDPEILNNLAWVLATSPEEKLRSGQRAIELAEKAAQLTDYKAPHILSTLAAGYAEVGDFEKAVEWSQKAVEADKADGGEVTEQLAQELESYQAGKPWRELQTLEEADEPKDAAPPGQTEDPAGEGDEGDADAGRAVQDEADEPEAEPAEASPAADNENSEEEPAAEADSAK